MMTAVTPLSSLPGAAKTIFLDFDGHFQNVWNRTDSNQRYEEVFSQPPRKSDAELLLSDAEIFKIWETVAEDFAPFNVNVTTVEPPSFANNAAVRVVIAGEVSASLVTGPQSYVSVVDDSFILNPNKDNPGQFDLALNSGYAALGSFTNAEPNVVYVFTEILKDIMVVTPTVEGNLMTLPSLIANTASHEVGHSFGLPHHTVDGTPNGDLHRGSTVTSPIMGHNIAGDRTLWSLYTNGSQTIDSKARLTTLLGARPDDHADSPVQTILKSPLNFAAINQNTSRATVSGIIEKTTDRDAFRFTTTGGNFTFDLKTVEFANLDAKLELFQLTTTAAGSSFTLLATIDGPLIFGKPFSFLGANHSRSLAAGTYVVAVSSHGSYGDVGNYKLDVTRSTGLIVGGGGIVFGTGTSTSPGFVATSITATPTTVANNGSLSSLTTSGAGGGGSASQRAAAVDANLSLLAEPLAGNSGGVKLAAKKTDPLDAIVREKLGSGLGSGSAARIVDLAFAA